MPPAYTLFLLSPANLNGVRGQLVFNPAATFSVAEALRSPAGAALGDVFAFISGLYFRGKKAYAEAFGRAPPGFSGGLVISPAEGLRFLYEPVTVERLQRWGEVPVDEREPRFVQPLLEHTEALLRAFGDEARYVLLGSVATNKYVAPLTQVLGERLLFPPDFVGRGDMSRGSLMLQAARSGQELRYAPVLGADRHGPRARGVSPTRRRAPPEVFGAGSVVTAPPARAEPASTGLVPTQLEAAAPARPTHEPLELVILVGLPGAGKTTFAEQRFAHSHERVSRDDLRRRRQPERLHGELIQRALRAGRSVVVDDTNVSSKGRALLIAAARAHAARVSIYLFTASARQCVAQNALRTAVARVPPIAIFAAARRLVRPGFAEDFDTLYCVRSLPHGAFEVSPDDAASDERAPASDG